MSIRKPVNGTVRADDFRDKAYSFVVESVLCPEKSPGIVVLSSSVGFLLTTSLTHQPKREQVIRYNRQSDGSWLATDVVTLLVTEESPVDGTVIIRDQRGEAVVLRVNPVSTSLSRLATPSLTISDPVLTFAGASPGEPSFQVLTIAQQHSDAAVTLTTDAPDYFQFASDSQPSFSPSLTLTPSPVGTYVHVRYATSTYGAHTGQLTIQSSAGKKTVALNGRSAGLLAALRPAGEYISRVRNVGLLALTILVGLAYAGYTNRCQLFPALCQNTAATPIVTDTPVSAPVSIATNQGRQQEVANQRKTRTMVLKLTKSSARQAPVRAPVDRPDDQPNSDVRMTYEQNNVSSSRSVVRNLSRPKPATQVSNGIVARQTRRRVLTPVLPAQESELERELNRNSQN